jgi:hypothetical protein
MSHSECIRDFEPGADDEGVAALWQRCFGDAAGGQTSDWLFREGAAGPCPRTVVESEGRIVAHAGVTALLFRVGDQTVRGGYSVAAMTDPTARRRGLFLRTAEALYERLEREDFAFVAGFSNAQSLRIMTGPLKRTAVRPFPWCVRLLSPLSIARSLLSGSRRDEAPGDADLPRGHSREGLDLKTCALDDPLLDPLWERCAPASRVSCVRDTAFARSRFATRPEAGYAAWVATRGGEPLAWAVTRRLSMRGLSALFLVDWLVAPEEAAAGRALAREIENHARSRGVELISALLPGSGAGRDALRSAGYYRVPERLHPQVIRFSVRGFGAFASCSELTNPSAWHLSWADTDVV